MGLGRTPKGRKGTGGTRTHVSALQCTGSTIELPLPWYLLVDSNHYFRGRPSVLDPKACEPWFVRRKRYVKKRKKRQASVTGVLRGTDSTDLPASFLILGRLSLREKRKPRPLVPANEEGTCRPRGAGAVAKGAPRSPVPQFWLWKEAGVLGDRVARWDGASRFGPSVPGFRETGEGLPGSSVDRRKLPFGRKRKSPFVLGRWTSPFVLGRWARERPLHPACAECSGHGREP